MIATITVIAVVLIAVTVFATIAISDRLGPSEPIVGKWTDVDGKAIGITSKSYAEIKKNGTFTLHLSDTFSPSGKWEVNKVGDLIFDDLDFIKTYNLVYDDDSLPDSLMLWVVNNETNVETISVSFEGEKENYSFTAHRK